MVKKTCLLLLTLLSIALSNAQDIEIKQAKNPYNKTLQWGNKGTILIAEDANGVTFKRTLHFITADGESSWQKEFLPKVKKPIPVFNDASKYIYFFDQIKDLGQTVSFTQFGPSGVSKQKAIKFRTALRTQLGSWVNSSLFKIEEIKTLQEDIVFLFSYYHKEKDVVMYAVMRMDHNSLVPKCTFVPDSNSMDDLKNGRTGHITCIGDQGGNIFFSKNVMKKDQKSNQLYTLSTKNNWTQKYLKYVPKYAPYPSNARLIEYGTIKNNKPGINGKKKLNFTSDANNILFYEGKIINYAFTSKDKKSRETIRIFVQDLNGDIIWDKNILFSEFISDPVLLEKGKPEQLFLDAFMYKGKIQLVAKGKIPYYFEINMKNGEFKKKEISIQESNFLKNPYQLIHGTLKNSSQELEIVLNNGIYSLKPEVIEKGHLFLKKK